jgi:hypothetical protein
MEINRPSGGQIKGLPEKIGQTDQETTHQPVENTKIGFASIDAIETPQISNFHPAGIQKSDIVQNTVDFILSEMDSLTTDESQIFNRLQSLNPEQLKEVMQELTNRGEFQNVLRELLNEGTAAGAHGVQMGQLLGTMLNAAQSDPEMIEILRNALSLPEMQSALPAFLNSIGNDPELLKILPEETLLAMLPKLQSDGPGWKAVYDAIQLKGPSQSASFALVADTVNFLVHEDTSVTSNEAAMFERLQSLTPEDLQKVLQALDDSGRLDSVLHEMIDEGPSGTPHNAEMGQFMKTLLNETHENPELLPYVEQMIADPDLNGALPSFVQSCSSEDLAGLPQEVLVSLLSGLGNNTDAWKTVYDAIQQQGPSQETTDAIVNNVTNQMTYSLDPSQLENLTPADRKAALQMLLANDPYNQVLGDMADRNPEIAGQLLRTLLNDAQSDPEMMAMLGQILSIPRIMEFALPSFMSSVGDHPEMLTGLSEDTLQAMMTRLAGTPQWQTAYEALDMKRG